MSPSERTVLGRRDPVRPQYATSAPGISAPYYPPYAAPPPNAWLGPPLISMTRCVPPSAVHTPVSKLAAHTQGAPLIIQSRYDRRKYTNGLEQRNFRSCCQDYKDRCYVQVDRGARKQQQARSSSRGGRNSNADAVSVASDESSGSANSETMLPRIIKPRKRRKKDRKTNVMSQDDSIGISDFSEKNLPLESASTDFSSNAFERSYDRNNTMQYHLDLKILKYPDLIQYRVPFDNEMLKHSRLGLSEEISPTEYAIRACRCRYCEPGSQTWDAGSIADLLDDNSSGEFAPTKLEDSMKVVGSLGRRGTDTPLRRSWSDPSSQVDRRNQVVADTLSTSSSRLYSLFPTTSKNSTPEARSPISLEFSSEITALFSPSTNEKVNHPRKNLCNDNCESAIGGCKMTLNDKVKSAINSETLDVSDSQCTFKCDLALVTV